MNSGGKLVSLLMLYLLVGYRLSENNLRCPALLCLYPFLTVD